MLSGLIERFVGLTRSGVAVPEQVDVKVGPEGPRGEIAVPCEGDGAWVLARAVDGTPSLAPGLKAGESCRYIYFAVPESFRRVASDGLWVTVEYFGQAYAPFWIQYVSTDLGAPHEGVYKPALQFWVADTDGRLRFRRALFPMKDFDAARLQNCGASFRVEARQGALIRRVTASRQPPPDQGAFSGVAPVPWLPSWERTPERFSTIQYLFVELTNACNFKCTWCPDAVMTRRRGFMKKEQAFRIFDEVVEKRAWLGPVNPVKLHQMGEPMLHPDLPEIVAYAESRDVPIELNTNCGFVTAESIDALYAAGLTNLILSYQTPDAVSFKTRKAPRMLFDDYREKVRLAIERKVASRARTRVQIDIMNTKHVDGERIVSEDEAAVAHVEAWIAAAREIERRHGLPARTHDMDWIRSFGFLDKSDAESRYEILDGVHVLWKHLHNWGNTVGPKGNHATPSTYCPFPTEQMVIQWNGDVATCCTDYEGLTRVANVFESSVEHAWSGEVMRQRRKDMWDGRLLPVCAQCQGRAGVSGAEGAKPA
jgi:MoaA/NifB/PqqE/SkfB family radical SAM enzyme